MKKISSVLKELNILNHQNGCSTGSKWFANGKKNISYSPVNVEKMISTLNKLKTSTKRKKALTQHQQRTYFSRKVPAC